MSPSPASIDLKKPENIINGMPKHITCRYSHPMERISPSAPNKDKILSPNNSPKEDRNKLITTAINMACSALLSASFLLF